MKITPHRDRIIVTLLEADTVSVGGILIPDAAKEKPNRGRDDPYPDSFASPGRSPSLRLIDELAPENPHRR
jgi:hypothetical protein